MRLKLLVELRLLSPKWPTSINQAQQCELVISKGPLNRAKLGPELNSGAAPSIELNSACT